jgi:DNA-binding PadR family transcriptional regulator
MLKNGFIKKNRVKGTLGPARIEYSITAKGKEYLASWISSLEVQQKAISRLITNYKKSL